MHLRDLAQWACGGGFGFGFGFGLPLKLASDLDAIDSKSGSNRLPKGCLNHGRLTEAPASTTRVEQDRVSPSGSRMRNLANRIRRHCVFDHQATCITMEHVFGLRIRRSLVQYDFKPVNHFLPAFGAEDTIDENRNQLIIIV